MRKGFLPLLISLLLLFQTVVSADETEVVPRTAEAALARAKEYARAINFEFKTPEKIYAFLCREFREQMSEDEFIEAFNKERSYPYITPLYIFFPEITEETGTGDYIVTFLQAARIEGMKYDIKMVYEDGNWFVVDWEQFPDGSYLEKFENIPYSLDWYYDFSDNKQGG